MTESHSHVLHLVYSCCSVRERVVLKTCLLRNNFAYELTPFLNETFLDPVKYHIVKRKMQTWKRFTLNQKKRLRNNSWSRKRVNREDLPILWIPL